MVGRLCFTAVHESGIVVGRSAAFGELRLWDEGHLLANARKLCLGVEPRPALRGSPVCLRLGPYPPLPETPVTHTYAMIYGGRTGLRTEGAARPACGYIRR